MTLQEKIGQLVRRTDVDKNTIEMIKAGKIKSRDEFFSGVAGLWRGHRH